jgi:hypothetical protein
VNLVDGIEIECPLLWRLLLLAAPKVKSPHLSRTVLYPGTLLRLPPASALHFVGIECVEPT